MEGLGLSLETQILIRETDEEIDYEFESYATLRERNGSFNDHRTNSCSTRGRGV